MAWAVGKLYQFLHNPTELHMEAAMQILAYYAGTIDLGIEFGLPQGQQPPPEAFAKASAIDHTTPNCNREYSGNSPGNISDL